MSVEPGQIRAHRKTGLIVEVIRQRPKVRDWAIRYVDFDDPHPNRHPNRNMAEATLLEHYPLVEKEEPG